MATWMPFVDWMGFRQLDAGPGIDGAFTIAYKITDDSGEQWSNRFCRVKAKEVAAIAGAVSVLRAATPALIEALKVKAPKTAFVPALSSSETHASEKSVTAIFAQFCAKAASAQFALDVLSKQVHTPIHHMGALSDRDAELDKAAYVADSVSASTVFIVDDFITRGSTLLRIARAVRSANAHVTKIYAIALGKTERRSYMSSVSNDHVPGKWSEAWDGGEERFRERQAGGRK